MSSWGERWGLSWGNRWGTVEDNPQTEAAFDAKVNFEEEETVYWRAS